MKNNDYFNRLLVLLLIVLAVCAGLYELPGKILEYNIRKVDILADVRYGGGAGNDLLDSLRMQLEGVGDRPADSALLALWQDVDVLKKTDSVGVGVADSVGDGVADSIGVVIDSVALSAARRDSIGRVMGGAQGVADPRGERIEDYSAGQMGLKRFFIALGRSRTRNVRIAFMGDSFIEGDIMVADFRSALQQMFGGRGVGFVPVTTTSPQYRPTVDQKATGWKTSSVVNKKAADYTLSGMLFDAAGERAALSFTTTTRYAALRKVNALKFIYDRNEATDMQLIYNMKDTVALRLPPTYLPAQYELSDTVSEGSFTFNNAWGFRAIGLALEDSTGVVVDNYSLRGNSGLVLEQMDPVRCAALNAIRPYDLIILQYGLNAMDEDMLDYGWYGTRMARVVRHVGLCFPGADILMIGVPDRANRYNGTPGTMPAVLALLHTQRQTARSTGTPFWNMFGAMGGENSMVGFVDKGWAGKDYTHLTFGGGRELARLLVKVLMKEREFYDEM
ncbi:MAG: hypothetical protein LBI58_01475 [Tannerellaceae bacterium]|jgi:hypothetical protein|nr:hypothetical protein [Tannerellaceae bacterium]